MRKKASSSVHPDVRLKVYAFIILVLSAALICRLFQLQIIRGTEYRKEAEKQSESVRTLKVKRGEIKVQDKDSAVYTVAMNKALPLIYAVPRDIENPEETSRILAEILEMPAEDIRKRIQKPEDPYEPLRAKASDEIAQRIQDARLKGIGVQYVEERHYPLEKFVCHVIGFVGYSGDERVGQYGIEEYYNTELEGKEGFIEGQKSAGGYLTRLGKRFIQKPEQGSDLILTVDQNIQFRAEEILNGTVKKWSAESGTIIVTEPKKGKILAMASLPDFDPNMYSSVESLNVFLNPAVQKPFEPGSIFKPITMAAALDMQAVTPETIYTDKGSETIGDRTIYNFDRKGRGVQTMTEVLVKSLNTGAIFAERSIGHDAFLRYVKNFGFGENTGIDMSGEASGNIENLSEKSDVNFATASFGQGITATPIQIVQAIGAIANGGTIMKPYIVDKIVTPEKKGEVRSPQVVRQIIAPKTAHQLTAMMVSVIEKSVTHGAVIEGYDLAGKTGTAQMPDPEKGGYSEDVVHSFVGFGPASDPQFLIFIKIERPRGIRFAESTLSEPFRDLAEFILHYYEIPPE